MTKDSKSLLENVSILKYQELFQIGLEHLLSDCWKKLNSFSQLHFAAEKVELANHVQSIQILVAALKVKMPLKLQLMERSEEIVLGKFEHFSYSTKL